MHDRSGGAGTDPNTRSEAGAGQPSVHRENRVDGTLKRPHGETAEPSRRS